MALRVSLQIDGDAKGAEEAAAAAARAVGDLGKTSDAASKAMQAGFEAASGKAAGLAGATKAAGAANDNAANAAIELLSKFSEVAAKVKGVDSTLAQAASGVTNFAGGLTKLAAGGAGFSIITGGIGLAIAAASTFYEIVNKGSKTTSDILAQQTRQIELVRGAYSGAAVSAGEFYQQSKLVTQVLLTASTIDLRKKLQTEVGAILSKTTTFGNFGDVLSQTKQVKEEFLPFEDAILKLNQGFRTGTPDVKGYVDEIARLITIDPATRIKAGAGLINEANTKASDFDNRIKANLAGFARTEGISTPEGNARLGISGAATARDTTDEFDRMVKSMQRQAAAQEAEAAATGASVGQAAKLRAQYLLNEAAVQANIKVTGEYADKLNVVSGRLAEAAQNSALARLKSDLRFDQGQLGRTASEASIADRLRGVFGDDVSGAMNGATGDLIRFNDQMRELKGVSIEVSQGAFRDFRTEMMNGATAFEAFGKAGVNALSRISDKLADKALDGIVTRIFGSFVGGGSGSSGIGSAFMGGGSPSGYAYGGYTGPGDKYEPAGIVHRGEVVWSQNDVSRAGGVDVVEGMRRGLRGYADGGTVDGTSLARAGKTRGSAAMTAPLTFRGGDVHIAVQGDANSGTVQKMKDMLEERDARLYYDVIESVRTATASRDL